MDLTEAPHFVLTKLATLSHAAASAVIRNDELNAKIENLRSRYSGHLVRAGDHPEKLRAEIEQALAEQKALQARRPIDMSVIESCKNWLAALPPATLLEQVTPVVEDGMSLSAARTRVKKLQSGVEALKHVPIPAPNIREKVQDYVQGLTRPMIGGIGVDETLTVRWPSDMPALMAFLTPDVLVDRLLVAINQIANTPCPLAERQQRIDELEKEIDQLQRCEEAIVVATGAPRERDCLPWVVLGVKAVEARGIQAA